MTPASLKPLPSALLLFAIGCSDAPATPPQGAANLSVVSSGCNATITRNLPSFDGVRPTTASQVGNQVSDNSNGASVACTVHKTKDGFTIKGDISVNDNSFAISGDVTSGGSLPYEGTGTVAFYSPETLGLAGEGCAITVNEAQSESIGSGKVWASFECPLMHPNSAASNGCRTSGAFVFGNCAE